MIDKKKILKELFGSLNQNKMKRMEEGSALFALFFLSTLFI